jgi:hypothetical protein
MGVIGQRQTREMPAERDDGIIQIELSRITPNGKTPRLWVLYSWLGS